MGELSEAERLTKLETQIEAIETMLIRLETKIDAWQSNFVSKELLEEKLKARDERIGRLENEKTTNKNVYPLWGAVVLSAVSIIINIITFVHTGGVVG